MIHLDDVSAREAALAKDPRLTFLEMMASVAGGVSFGDALPVVRLGCQTTAAKLGIPRVFIDAWFAMAAYRLSLEKEREAAEKARAAAGQ